MNRNIQDDSWLLWQLADSAFPTGGFAHSGGLEAAWQAGEISDSAELASFLEASLRQTVSSMIPFVTTAFHAPEQLAMLDQRCDAFLINHVANRASRLQGRAFSASVKRIFNVAELNEAPFGHLAPIFGGVTRLLKLTASGAVELFLFQNLRSWLASAVRLGVIGPMEGQKIQFQLIPTARKILNSASQLSIDDVATTSPILEILQGGQDRLYSRLFQS